MHVTGSMRAWWRGGLALTAITLAPFAVNVAPAHAAPPVRVMGCNTASLSTALVAGGVSVVAPKAEDEANDQDEEDQEPKITGSIRKPRGIGEDDSKKLTPHADRSAGDA